MHQPFALIGRDQRADVPLDHRLVSRRHLYLQIVAGQAFWIDLDSRSGTSAEGQVRKYGWLDPEKSIRVGPFELGQLPLSDSVTGNREPMPGPRLSPLVARSCGDQVLPEVFLEFLNGPSRSACWPMNRVMSLIGSANGCKFRLADPSVSPFHCSLLRTALGLWIVDLRGPDGIAVNDAPVRYARLGPDDVLSVGRYRIRIRVRSSNSGFEEPALEERRPVATTETRTTVQAPLAPVFSNGGSAGLPILAANPWQVLATEMAAADGLGRLVTGNACVPAAVDLSTRLEKGEITESLLVPLLNQFGQMQQQMLDQFQQAISMIVQMFGTMHRDQMATIREELDQLRELTREFQALKLELAARSPDHAAIASFGPTTKAPDGLLTSTMASTTREQLVSCNQ